MRQSTKTLAVTGMFTAVICVLSVLMFPMPSGVPVTLQTFAMALCGYVLGWKQGITAVGLYLVIGAVGIPVFAGMTAGPSVLAGCRGGFLWGFLLLALFCGRKAQKTYLQILFGILGLLLCHICGALQYAAVMSVSVTQALVLVSLPYLIKDVGMVAGAYAVSRPIRKAIRREAGR